MSLLSACLRRSACATPSLRLGAARAAVPALSHVRCSSAVPTVTTSSGNVVPVDKYFDDESLVAHQARVRHADPANRTFNYTMLGGARFLGASSARLVAVKFLASMNPAADVLALASLEVDISNLEVGNCMVVKWRGKPVFVRARTGARARGRPPHMSAYAAAAQMRGEMRRLLRVLRSPHGGELREAMQWRPARLTVRAARVCSVPLRTIAQRRRSPRRRACRWASCATPRRTTTACRRPSTSCALACAPVRAFASRRPPAPRHPCHRRRGVACGDT